MVEDCVISRYDHLARDTSRFVSVTEEVINATKKNKKTKNKKTKNKKTKKDLKSIKDAHSLEYTFQRKDMKYLLIELNEAIKYQRKLALSSIRVIKAIKTEWFQRQNEYLE